MHQHVDKEEEGQREQQDAPADPFDRFEALQMAVNRQHNRLYQPADRPPDGAQLERNHQHGEGKRSGVEEQHALFFLRHPLLQQTAESKIQQAKDEGKRSFIRTKPRIQEQHIQD
ncbi:hypothetical protein D3C80_1520840 [compost metagenome]